MSEKSFKSYDALIKAAKDAGVSDKRLDQAIESHNLPAEGTFGDPILVVDESKTDEQNMSHILMPVTDGNKCSTSRIKAMVFIGNIENLTETDLIKGKQKDNADGLYLPSQTMNKHLPSNQAKLAMELRGKKFKAEPVTGWFLPFKRSSDGKPVLYKTLDEVKTSAKSKTVWNISVTP